MPRKPLHENGIAVFAGMGAAGIRVDTILHAGDACLRKDRADSYFVNFLFHNQGEIINV